MKLSTAIAVRGERLKGKTRQNNRITGQVIPLLAFGAVLSGFLCLVFFASSNYFEFAIKSQDPIFAPLKNIIGIVRANENTPLKNFHSEICAQPLPKASIANPNLNVFKIEKMCIDKEGKIEAQAADINSNLTSEELRQGKLAEDIAPILEGTPMENMVEPISKTPRIVAAYLVGIAKKESQLGKYAPSKNGKDCFNYWGFKGWENPVAGGYSCFESPNQAIETVGAKISELAIDQKCNTPPKMTVWKCGSSCETHPPKSVSKWIDDVSVYFYQINKPKQN